jgi:hypothetical protein
MPGPELHAVDEVAWLALLYRTCDRGHYTNPHGPMEDLECNSGEISIAMLEALSKFSDLDWEIVGILIDFEHLVPVAAEELAAAGASVSAYRLRAEALLHAATDKDPHAYVGQAWAEAFLQKRWWAVEQNMRGLVEQGLTARRDEINQVVLAAYQSVTGSTVQEYLDDWEFPYMDLWAGEAV